MRVFKHVLCPDSDRLRNEVAFYGEASGLKVYEESGASIRRNSAYLRRNSAEL
jgi:hypothetical protein